MVKARKYVLRSHFSGLPKREDLEIVEEELPALKDGGQTYVPTRGLHVQVAGPLQWLHLYSLSLSLEQNRMYTVQEGGPLAPSPLYKMPYKSIAPLVP